MSVIHSRARSACRHDLRQRRRIAAREDVFAQPRIGRAGPVHAADRMQQGDPVRRQQLAHLARRTRGIDRRRHARTCRPRRFGRSGRSPRGSRADETGPGRPARRQRRAAFATLSCSSDSVSPVTSAPHSLARYSPSPPHPQPMSSTFARAGAAAWRRCAASCSAARSRDRLSASGNRRRNIAGRDRGTIRRAGPTDRNDGRHCAGIAAPGCADAAGGRDVSRRRQPHRQRVVQRGVVGDEHVDEVVEAAFLDRQRPVHIGFRHAEARAEQQLAVQRPSRRRIAAAGPGRPRRRGVFRRRRSWRAGRCG